MTPILVCAERSHVSGDTPPPAPGTAVMIATTHVHVDLCYEHHYMCN